MHDLVPGPQRNCSLFRDVHPQTGSRTSRREPTVGCWSGAASRRVSEFRNPRSIHATARRNSATAQHNATSQIKNRITREDSMLSLVGLAVIVCKGKSRSQTKSSDFNSLRREVDLVGAGLVGVG